MTTGSPFDADPAVVAAARALADRARHDGISAVLLMQAAKSKLRPGFAAALAYALEAGWIEGWQGVEKDGPGVHVLEDHPPAGERSVP